MLWSFTVESSKPSGRDKIGFRDAALTRNLFRRRGSGVCEAALPLALFLPHSREVPRGEGAGGMGGRGGGWGEEEVGISIVSDLEAPGR